MRATIIAAAGVVACLGLAGCDNSSEVPAGGQQAVQPIDCQAQVAAAIEATKASMASQRVRHRHVRREASYPESGYDEGAAYSYRSQSRSYYQGEYEGAEESGTMQAGQAEGAVWVDGYGHGHYVVTASAPTLPPANDRARLDPWHGYDEK